MQWIDVKFRARGRPHLVHKLQREIRRDHMDPLARQQWQQQMKVQARALRARLREKR